MTYSDVARRLGRHVEQVRRAVCAASRYGWLTVRGAGRHQPAGLDLGAPLPARTGLPAPAELVGERGSGSVCA